MVITQIDGDSQIRNETIYDAQIAPTAAIALSKLAEAVIQADGGQAFTDDQSMAGFKLTTVGTPTLDGDAANKAYVDSMVTAGISWLRPVRVAAPVMLPTPFSYTEPTVTSDIDGILMVDDVELAINDRILLMNGPVTGTFVVVSPGAVDAPWVVTRSSDVLMSGSAMFVNEGTVNKDKGFVLTTDDPIIIGVTTLTFVQFTSLGQITAGAGLTKTGSTLDVGAGDGIQVNADSIEIALAANPGLTKSGGLKVGAGNGIEVVGATVAVKLDTTSGLNLTGGDLAVGAGDGIQVDAASITVKLDGASLLKSGSGVKVDYSRWITRETPSGSLPGTEFTTANAVLAGTEQVFLNGLLQEAGGADYTFSSTNTITFVDTVKAGRRVRVNYIKA